MTESIELYDSLDSSPKEETLLGPAAQQLKDDLDLEAEVAAEHGWKEPLRSERVALALRHHKINAREAIELLRPLPGEPSGSRTTATTLDTSSQNNGDTTRDSDSYRNPSEPLHEPPVRGSIRIN